MNLVSIIVPCMNLLWQTKLCIEAIGKNVDYPFELIVVNNNSTDGTKEFLDEFAYEYLKDNQNYKGYHVIHNDTNRYLAGAINDGVVSSVGDYISIVANDIVVPQNMYKFMIEKLDEDKSIGAIGPWYTEDARALLLDHTDLYYSVNRFITTAPKEDKILNSWHFSVCHIMRRDVWEKVGLWDEKLKTHCNDNDWGIRLELAGYKAVTYKKYLCYHHYGSLGRKQIHGESIVAKNDTRYFYEKWGIYSHQKTNEIPENIKEVARKGNYLK